MKKTETKGKGEAHFRHVDELDDVDALFFLSEEEPSPAEDSARRAKRKRSKRTVPLKILALVSRKGGTGKTSLAMNLAALLSTSRRKVVVLDLDRGGDAVKWQDRGRKLPFAVVRVDGKSGKRQLTKSINEVKGEADLLILDTPPANTKIMSQAVQAADLVLIPTGPSSLDLMATVEVVKESLQVHSAAGGKTPSVAIVPSRLILGTRLAKELPQQLKKLSLPVAPSIGQRVEVAAAFSEGRIVRPKSQAGVEFARLARFVRRNLRTT